MESNWVDFRTVKAAVSMQQVLDHYRIRLRKVNATYLRGKCPLPMHTSQGSGDSFGVDLSKQAWACQSDSCVKARGGRKGGNVLEFVALKEGLTVRDAALKLAEWFKVESPGPEIGSTKTGATKPHPKPESAKPEEGNVEPIVEPNKPLTFALKGVDPTHAYLKSRGISEETASHFGVGYFGGAGSMRGRIVFPIRNPAGELVAYAGRVINDSGDSGSNDPRWKFPTGFRKSIELFGIQEAAESPVIALVESFWGVLALHQAGIPAVALMGRSMSVDQQALLEPLGSASIILMLDGDEPGRTATAEIAIRLAREYFVRIITLPGGRQPDHLKPDELWQLIGPCMIEPRA